MNAINLLYNIGVHSRIGWSRMDARDSKDHHHHLLPTIFGPPSRRQIPKASNKNRYYSKYEVKDKRKAIDSKGFFFLFLSSFIF